MTCQYCPDCSCNHYNSILSVCFPESQQPSGQARRYTDNSQNPDTQLAAQQLNSPNTIVRTQALQSSLGHIYQTYGTSAIDEYSSGVQDIPHLAHNEQHSSIYCGVALHGFHTFHQDFQLSNDVSIEQHLNPEAPSFVPSSIDSGSQLNPEAPSFIPASIALNPEAPSFVPSSIDSRRELNPETPSSVPIVSKVENELNPEAATFTPSLSLENKVDQEAPAVLLVDTDSKNEEIHELEKDFDCEARFFAASQLSPDDFAPAPFLWPFAFHHLNYFGHPIGGKCYTPPAANLAILKSHGKYRAAKYAENLRISVLQASASQWLDPLVFVGNIEDLWYLEGTELQDAATGACHKLYHPHGEWKADNWDEDDDYPMMDEEESDKSVPGHVIINGKFDESFLDRREDTAELNSQYQRFVSRQNEARQRIREGKAAPKSGLRMCTTVDDLDREAESFKARFEAYDKPLPPKWADLCDDEDDEPCAPTDDSWKSRCLPPQDGRGDQSQSDSSSPMQEEPLQQGLSERSLFTRGTELRSPRGTLSIPGLPTICEEDEEEQNTVADEPLDPTDRFLASGLNMICVEDEEDQGTIDGALSDLLDLIITNDPVDEGKDSLANDDVRNASPAIDSLSNGNETDIIEEPIKTLPLRIRRSPRQQLALRDTYDGPSNPRPRDSNSASSAESPDSASPSTPDSTTTTSPIDSAAINSQDSANAQLGPSAAIQRQAGSPSSSTTTVVSDPSVSSEHLAPIPALPTFRSVRRRPTWSLRAASWRSFGSTRASDPIEPTTTGSLSQGAILSPVRSATEELMEIHRRNSLVKKSRTIWAKVRDVFSKKQNFVLVE